MAASAARASAEVALCERLSRGWNPRSFEVEEGKYFRGKFKSAKDFRTAFENVCKRRFIYGPAFDPYGGVGGLFDYGPVGCSVKTNLLALWRSTFIHRDDMVEIEATCVTPEPVFKASGHVDRFTDVMVRDTVTGECFRLDKLIEEECAKRISGAGKKEAALSEAQKEELRRVAEAAGGMTRPQMAAAVAQIALKSPAGNPLSEPFDFNLMFRTSIGPEGTQVAYLRPELAQGIFVNFPRLYEVAARMPFAAACVGMAFRNEIAPRAGLIRVREFQLAEIEHFVNPADKSHPKFASVADCPLLLFTRELQEEFSQPTPMTVGDAVRRGVINNETLGYFMARTAFFLASAGARIVRFRQHRSNEMAHYAADCWDAELLTSYGWVECVGIADRACYDLSAHGRATGVSMEAFEPYKEPRDEEIVVRKVAAKEIGQKLREAAGATQERLKELTDDEALALSAKLHAGEPVTLTVTPKGRDAVEVTLTKEMFSAERTTHKVSGYKYTPSVIEPSFGVGRITYAILEQSFWQRPPDAAAEEEKGKDKGADIARNVLGIPPVMAPVKVAVLSMGDATVPLAEQLHAQLTAAGISARVDTSVASVGRRYARCDEVGVPFAVTVDPHSVDASRIPDGLTDPGVTLRERDSCAQVRVNIADVLAKIQALASGAVTWEEVGGAKFENEATKKVGMSVATERFEKEAAARGHKWGEEEELALLKEIEKQGAVVRRLKAEKVDAADAEKTAQKKRDIEAAVVVLTALKKKLADGPDAPAAAPAH